MPAQHRSRDRSIERQEEEGMEVVQLTSKGKRKTKLRLGLRYSVGKISKGNEESGRVSGGEKTGWSKEKAGHLR